MRSALSSYSAGYLFNKSGLAILLAMLTWFAWLGQTRVVLLLGLALATGAFAKLWAKSALIRVSCTRTLDKTRVFPGEVVCHRLEVVNRKPLPLPWMEVAEEIPSALMEIGSLEPCRRNGFGLSRSHIALGWYASVGWENAIKCQRRGFYPLGAMEMTSGDLFGFFTYTRRETNPQAIVVYPRIYALLGLTFPSRTPLGESKADQDIFHDPSRIVGLRDYTHKDSLRHVHWKASAKKGQMQVKVFESTLTLTTALFLGVDDFKNDSVGAEKFELAVSTAASIAARLIEQKSRVALFANARPVDSERQVNLAPGSSHGHLIHILETLAKINAFACRPFQELIDTKGGMPPAGCTIVAVIAALNPRICDCLSKLKMRGHPVIIITMEAHAEAHPELDLPHFLASLHPQSDQLYFRKVIA